ncbi:MAG: ABC transporter permease [Actinobacteria bacterium]|nr:ABC transporter permease [Actinomycetota bacterium]MCA1721783.1 ABC transporter permease [Actinomycetota bacterium]
MTAAFSDALALTGRNLRRVRREPELLFFSTVQPVIFVLLFRYVFGGAIKIPGLSYVDFLMPGIFVQTTAFASTATGVALADDLTKGIIDRFRSLPMARSAVLAGRSISDLLRILFTVLVMVVVGVAVGLRFHQGFAKALAALALVAFFGFAFTWISAWIGLSVKSVETANLAGFVWLFPLTFASSAFAPVSTMPGWLQAFAKATPVTPTVDAVRALVNGGPTARPLLISVCWLVAITAVFSTLAVRKYRSIS